MIETQEQTQTQDTDALAVVVYRDLAEAQAADLLHAPSGIVAEVVRGAALRGSESEFILAAAKGLFVLSASDHADGLEIVRRAKLAAKGADEERKSYTDLLNRVVKLINGQYRQAIVDGDTAAQVAWGKCQAFEVEERRRIEEAARKERERLEAIERKAREEAEAARRAEEEALRKAEAARAVGDGAAARAAEQEAARKAAMAERREDRADIAAATPVIAATSATVGARKAAGLTMGRTLPTWEYDGEEEACVLRVARAAVAGNVAALRCLTINGTAALLQSKAGAKVDGLRFGVKTAAPGVRVK